MPETALKSVIVQLQLYAAKLRQDPSVTAARVRRIEAMIAELLSEENGEPPQLPRPMRPSDPPSHH